MNGKTSIFIIVVIIDMKMTGGNKSISHQDQKQIQNNNFGMFSYIDELKHEDGIERQSFQFVLLSVTEETQIQSKSFVDPTEYNISKHN